jgi:hypothetical protein
VSDEATSVCTLAIATNAIAQQPFALGQPDLFLGSDPVEP